jgi:hypothetical protein
MNRSKFVWTLIFLLAFGLATQVVAQTPRELNDSQEPGSVLVFHKFVTGTVPLNGTTAPKTEIELSVTCPKGLDCFENTRVKLKAHWVCPGTQAFDDKYICRETDFNLWTTIWGTLAFDPGEGIIKPPNVSPLPGQGGLQRIPKPPCSKGYLIVWVVNFADQPIKFDALIGNAVIRHNGASAGAYNAIPIKAVSTLPLSPYPSSTSAGSLTDADADGHLDFDGLTEYQAVTGQISGTVRFERTDDPVAIPPIHRIDTFLTLLTLDVKSNRPNSPVVVDLNFYNHFEEVTSTFWEFVCWSQVRLSRIDRNLDEVSQGSRKGLVVSGPAERLFFPIDDEESERVTLLAIIETMEYDGDPPRIVREYSYSTYNDSVPVPTSFEP